MPAPGTERSPIGGRAVFAEAGGVLHARDARTGAEFWRHRDPVRSVSGVPSAYAADGRTFVAVQLLARPQSSQAGRAVKPFLRADVRGAVRPLRGRFNRAPVQV